MPLGPQKFYNVLDHTHDSCRDWVVVNWNLGNKCNYTCSYCPDVLHDGSYGWNEFDVVIAFINKVIEHYAPRKIYFEFTGGEVTVWKHFMDMAQYIKEQGHDVGFISNGSRTVRWWNKNKEWFDHVCLSWHPEHADLEHYLEVVKLMSDTCRTHTNVMLHNDPELFAKGVILAERLRDECTNISMALQPLIHEFGTVRFDYTEEQLEIIEQQHELYGAKVKHTKEYNIYRGSMDMIDTVNDLKQSSSAQRFIADNTNNWSGWDCLAGVEQIVIDYNGAVMRGWCKVGGAYGNIKNPNNIAFWRLEKPIRCNKDYCHCNFDIMCKKELPADRYTVEENDVEEND